MATKDSIVIIDKAPEISQLEIEPVFAKLTAEREALRPLLCQVGRSGCRLRGSFVLILTRFAF